MIEFIKKEDAENDVKNDRRGLFCYHDGAVFVAIDNTTGDQWMEEFSTQSEACDWLLSGDRENEDDDKMQDARDLFGGYDPKFSEAFNWFNTLGANNMRKYSDVERFITSGEKENTPVQSGAFIIEDYIPVPDHFEDVLLKMGVRSVELYSRSTASMDTMIALMKAGYAVQFSVALFYQKYGETQRLDGIRLEKK